MNLVCCMKSKDSYKRISLKLKDLNINMEDFIQDLEDLLEKLVFSAYDLAVIDEKLWWINDAVELLEKKETKVLIFQGDYGDLVTNIEAYINNQNSSIPPSVDPDFSPEEAVPQTDDISENVKIKFIEKEKHIYVDREVRVPEYKTIFAGIKSQMILIANLSKRAGSTFFTVNLARYLSSLNVLCSVIEPPIDKPYIFDTIDIEKRYEKNSDSLNFYSYPHVINSGEVLEKDKETIIDGIVWIVPDSRRPLIQASSWDYLKMVKLLYSAKKASITLVDCGSNLMHESIYPLINEADYILVIVDPLPTECMQNNELHEHLLELKKKNYPVEYIINRWNAGIDKEQFKDFIMITPLMLIPAINPKYIYKAVYDGIIPFDIKEVSNILQKPLAAIISKLLPKEILINTSAYAEENKTSLIDNIKSRILKNKGAKI